MRSRFAPGGTKITIPCRARVSKTPKQKLIVPTGNEKEAALILAKPGHDGCGVFPVSLLSEVTDFFAGRRTLENALKQRIAFESVVERAVDFGKIRGQGATKDDARQRQRLQGTGLR